MLERIVENWLTRCTERDYEVPFAQLLLTEGYRVLHGPVHHPFEHGKDIIALDAKGRLWAWQLKDGDLSLADLGQLQPQLLALAGAAATYPGLGQRRPDLVVLVTNGSLTPPARDRLDAFNRGNADLSLAAIECVEKEQLVARFVAGHGGFVPVEPDSFESLLRFHLSSGVGPFPLRSFFDFVTAIIFRAEDDPNQFSKSVASATLLSAYAVSQWQRLENHLGVAQGWLTLAAAILHAAERLNVDDAAWSDSYELALAGARRSLRALLDEVTAREDLVVPDLVEGAIYPTRVVEVGGFLSAHFISEAIRGDEEPIRPAVMEILKRELPFFKVSGEYAAPYVIAVATALELLGEPMLGRRLAFLYVRGLAHANRPLSRTEALPDPYHDFEDVLRRAFGAEVESPDERFEEHAYTLHPVINWLARRGERDAVAAVWPDVTRINLCEFQVSDTSFLMAPEDKGGALKIWHAAAPENWKRLSEASRGMAESEIPGVLWRHLEFLPYLLLLFPQRLTTSTEKSLEYAVTGHLEVTLDVSDSVNGGAIDVSE